MTTVQRMFLGTLVASLAGCSIEISQPVASPSVIPTITHAETPTAPTPFATALPGQQSPTASTRTPVSWSGLGLTGRLVYTTASVEGSNLSLEIRDLSLSTGEITPIFRTDGWVGAAAVSPDDEQIVISYAPPPGNTQGSQTSLYTIPRDGSQLPMLLFHPPSDDHQYDQPVWSPDGRYVYFRDVNYRGPTPFSLMRVADSGGNPEKLVDWAYWPRISPDGSRMTFVKIDPDTSVNSLFVAAPDGTEMQPVLLKGPYIPKVIDVPMFSADGQSILFSAPDLMQSFTPKWMDRLMGVTVALADGNIPSDWWTVPVGGGVPRQLTHIQQLGLYGSYSPDRQFIASYTSDNIFVMKPDGTGVAVLIEDVGGIAGSVDWTP